MRVRALVLLVAGVGFGAAAIPAAAHHSFDAEFDRNQPLTVTGTVNRLEWTNPHARVYVDTTDEQGRTVTWNFEMAGPNGLMRRGWTRNSLKPGDKITVTGYKAKNVEYVANANSVTLSDGRQVFAGSSAEQGQ